MAYIDRHSTQNRGPILVAIGALHAGVIYALVTGLAGFVPNLLPETRIEGTNIKLPPPPTTPDPRPTTKPDPRPRDTTTASTGGTFTTTSTDFTTTDTELTGGGGGGSGEGTFPGPETKPTQPADPVYPPKLARPVGKPGLWVTTNDYPSNELRMEHEGTTRFQLAIGADGKVQSCEITVSSGFAGLDKATCANLMKRGKFTAATDSSGAAVPGTYSSAVRWTIPKD